MGQIQQKSPEKCRIIPRFYCRSPKPQEPAHLAWMDAGDDALRRDLGPNIVVGAGEHVCTGTSYVTDASGLLASLLARV